MPMDTKENQATISGSNWNEWYRKRPGRRKSQDTLAIPRIQSPCLWKAVIFNIFIK